MIKKSMFLFVLFCVTLNGQPLSKGGSKYASQQGALYSRTISFAGYEWQVKSSTGKAGPGPNYFSDSEENVWLDSLDQLHMRITHKNGNWYCAEVVLQGSYGYGSYLFNVIGQVGAINENVILGLFTWDTNASNDYYREIDIEFARWGDASSSTNAQYVIQPYDVSGNMQRWFIPLDMDSSSHLIDWRSNNINFKGAEGLQKSLPLESEIFSWDYFGGYLTQPGNENIRINLWLRYGYAPTDTQEVEVVISDFQYGEDLTAFLNTEPVVPEHFTLDQNYPNPFNAQTTIAFQLEKAEHVQLSIYDVNGKQVTQPVNGFYQKGRQKLNFNAEKLASGIYYYVLSTSDFKQSKKMILIK